jgi:hypothetical protein
MMRRLATLLAVVLPACAADREPIVIELTSASASAARTFDVEGAREVTVVTQAPLVVEAWVDGGTLADVPAEQLAAGASASWLAPVVIDGQRRLTIEGDGVLTLTVDARGSEPPAPTRARSATWFDAALLDDSATISFARVMAAVSGDGHGGVLLERWFHAFADGPGAGRATFARFLGEIAAAQGSDPHDWNLGALPFKVTGIHNRIDLAQGVDCGELRVSVASTHVTFSPVHLLFIFRQLAQPDDVTPDGTVHCRGTARRWAGLADLTHDAFASAAADVLATTLKRDRFDLAESVELTISPWQWRQWRPDGAGGLVNPPLFQTVDVGRVNAAGATRDAFLAEVEAKADAIAARTWVVPAAFRSPVGEVQPTERAALVDLSPLGSALAIHPDLERDIGMIGCPRCHTDDADFVQTAIDRTPSPFYDKELDARTARIDALARGGWPPPTPFGPLATVH